MGKVSVVRKNLRRGVKNKVYGWYHPAGAKVSTPLIEIHDKLKGINELTIVVHECIHHCFPYLNEEEVLAKAYPLAKILWDDQWRRTNEPTGT